MPEETTFKIGDQVRHKSGGPILTVSDGPCPKGIFTVQWHDKGFQSATFHKDTLNLHVPTETTPPKVVLPTPPEPLKFKTGDRVRSNTGGPDMTLGVVWPHYTMDTQVECHWAEPAKEAIAGDDKTPSFPAVPETPHTTLFYLGQLVLLPSETTS